MKKLFLLLSGTIALAAMVNVNAMQQRLSKKQACDQINYLLGAPDGEEKDWQGVFKLIDMAMDKTFVNECRLSNGDTLLYRAVDGGGINFPVVKKLLETYHANPNIGRNRDKSAPLTMACLNACYDGANETVEVLLKHGANPFLIDDTNRDSLAATNGGPYRDDVIKLINRYTSK